MITTRELQEMLQHKAKELSKLADQIDDKGRKPSAREKKLIRFVLVDIMADHFDEALWFFSRGNAEDFATSVSRLLEEFEPFCK